LLSRNEDFGQNRATLEIELTRRNIPSLNSAV